MSELYQIQECAFTAGTVTARVHLNGDHDIFRGHFPGQPVMPGVCMMELICKVAEKKTGRPLRITGGPLLKFLNMVDPRKTPDLQVEMTLEEKDGRWQAVGKLCQDTLVFLKFQLALSDVPQSAVAPRGIS